MLIIYQLEYIARLFVNYDCDKWNVAAYLFNINDLCLWPSKGHATLFGSYELCLCETKTMGAFIILHMFDMKFIIIYRILRLSKLLHIGNKTIFTEMRVYFFFQTNRLFELRKNIIHNNLITNLVPNSNSWYCGFV